MMCAISRSNFPLNFLNSPASVRELDAQITKSSDDALNKSKLTRQGRSLSTRGVDFERPFSGGLNKPFTSSSLKPINSIKSNSSSSTGSTDVHLKVGYNVEHDRFGKGKITHLVGLGADKKATIFFPRHGSKTVLLRFANLKVVDSE